LDIGTNLDKLGTNLDKLGTNLGKLGTNLENRRRDKRRSTERQSVRNPKRTKYFWRKVFIELTLRKHKNLINEIKIKIKSKYRNYLLNSYFSMSKTQRC
jgi:hypothetical protein